MSQPVQESFDDYRMRTGRGGPRRKAGRPKLSESERRRVFHRQRQKIPKGCPVHVTLRMRRDVPRLRNPRLVREIRRSFAKACERGSFRVVHYSIQGNHVHMLVEAAGKEALACGMKSIAARFAHAVNRVFSRRGPVLAERFHHRVLRTPREVRNTLAYVLLNVRKHWREQRGQAPPVRLDEASSGRWFTGWKRRPPDAGSLEGPRDVAAPHSWLLVKGWRRHGLVDPEEVPGGVARAR